MEDLNESQQKAPCTTVIASGRIAKEEVGSGGQAVNSFNHPTT
jgi:hypothetical protein